MVYITVYIKMGYVVKIEEINIYESNGLVKRKYLNWQMALQDSYKL